MLSKVSADFVFVFFVANVFAGCKIEERQLSSRERPCGDKMFWRSRSPEKKRRRTF
jgi:hypothetical protein